MLGDSIGALINAQTSRPLSLIVAALALFVPGSLAIFLSKPSLFAMVGLQGVLLLSLAVSLPIVMLCFGIWWTPLQALLQVERMGKGIPDPTGDLVKAVSADDPLEWPCLFAGSVRGTNWPA